MGQSFWGMFCMSVALGDALLHLSVTCVFLAQDIQMFGLHLTKYQVCVLVQAASSVQGVLQWPVFILFALDILWREWHPCPHSVQALILTASVFLLWTMAMLYVFSGSSFHPLTRDEDNHVTLQHCQLTGGAHSRQVVWAALLTLVGVACYTHWLRRANGNHLRGCLGHFLSTWSSFLLLLLFILASGTEVPPYLDMNGVWLCFIHSLHTAAALRSCPCFFCAHTQDDTWMSYTSASCYVKSRHRNATSADTSHSKTCLRENTHTLKSDLGTITTGE